MSAPLEDPIGETPLNLRSDLDPELVEQFISDAREQLDHIEHSVLALEQNFLDREVLHTIFRAFHTFKGNAGFLDLTPIGQLAHQLESLLNEVRENRLQVSPQIIDLILRGRDTLKQFVDEVEAQSTGRKRREIILIPTASLRTAMRLVLRGGSPGPGVRLEFNSQGMLVETPVTVEPHADPTPASTSLNVAALDAVKVSTSKLDGLVNLAGELLIAQSLIVQTVNSPDVNRHVLARNLDQLVRISKELQRTAMSMRMVPIRGTLQKLHRLVRDISARQNKSVRLVLEGGDTEVDRTIVEKLSDPLMHMVANALDHAIEEPHVRAAQGKPATGTITLRAYHKSGNIVIEVEDDGQGLNRPRILQQGIKTGLLKPNANPDDKELFNLILQPGFSTAQVVTAISGRGVGMDVVQKNIGKLRGKIDIKSTPGRGTTFTLQLPLTLAIIDGLLIKVAGQRYILPTTSVCESFHPNACEITSLPAVGEVVRMRRELIPLLRLRDHFQLKSAPPPDGPGILIVIEADLKKRCLLADELVGKQEIVIKNLGEVFQTDPMVSGGAILGDGTVGLILDPAALVHLERPGQPRLLAAA